jgi:hypothetical protein
MVHELMSWSICVAVIGAVVPFFWSDLRTIRRRAAGPPAARSA